ncbi:MAG: leucyl aminopeptidase, partial [Halioglobus sp.]|nr:leucyl aminopeptidase [Halioglobus sp.]
QRPGDIVSTMSGKRIEVRNTDAEGRLVLADAIHYGDITYDPALLVDLATLTGSASRALGHNYAALFTRHEELPPGFTAAGEMSGDKVWRMPLGDDHFEAIESKVADVVNIAEDGPGLSTAAAFLGTFVRESTPWVHLDIAGVAYSDKSTPLKASPGSTSFGVGLIDAYIREQFETR